MPVNRGARRSFGRKRSATRTPTATSRTPGGNSSRLEDLLSEQIRLCGLPPPERQARLIPLRKFTHDFAWRDRGLCVEVQGQIWTKGGHTSGVGYLRDVVKMQLAALAGFQTIYVTAECIESGRALAVIESLLRSNCGRCGPKT